MTVQITQLADLVSGKQYYFKNAASTTVLSISHDHSFKGHRSIVGLKKKALDSQKWTVSITGADNPQYSFQSDGGLYLGLTGEGIVPGQRVVAVEDEYYWNVVGSAKNCKCDDDKFKIIAIDVDYPVTLMNNGSQKEDTPVDVQQDSTFHSQQWIILEAH